MGQKADDNKEHSQTERVRRLILLSMMNPHPRKFISHVLTISSSGLVQTWYPLPSSTPFVQASYFQRSIPWSCPHRQCVHGSLGRWRARREWKVQNKQLWSDSACSLIAKFSNRFVIFPTPSTSGVLIYHDTVGNSIIYKIKDGGSTQLYLITDNKLYHKLHCSWGATSLLGIVGKVKPISTFPINVSKKLQGQLQAEDIIHWTTRI